jgi:phosphoserine phosphatase RsbU/P
VTESAESTPPNPFARLIHVARALSGILDLDRLLPAILDGVIALAGAERGAVLLRDDTGDFVVEAVRDGHGRNLDPKKFSLSHSVLKEAATSGEAVLIDDAAEMDVYSQRRSIVSLNLRTILCSPLAGPGGTLGLLYVDSHLTSHRFTQEDRELIEAYAAVAVIALESVRLHAASRERDRMAYELDMASRIQRSFLPASFPEVTGYRGACRAVPAGQVGGDFYEFVEIADGRMAAILADVCGKGVPAALDMARYVSWLRSRATRSPDVPDLLRAFNRMVLEGSGGDSFVTVAVALLDPGSAEVDVFRCGHPPPLHVTPDGVSEVPGSTTPPLGLIDDLDPRPSRVTLRPGCGLLLYTDGALDARGVGGELFGQERLAAVVRLTGSGTEDLVDAVVHAVDAFAMGGRRADDLTIIALERVPR